MVTVPLLPQQQFVPEVDVSRGRLLFGMVVTVLPPLHALVEMAHLLLHGVQLVTLFALHATPTVTKNGLRVTLGIT